MWEILTKREYWADRGAWADWGKWVERGGGAAERTTGPLAKGRSNMVFGPELLFEWERRAKNKNQCQE